MLDLKKKLYDNYFAKISKTNKNNTARSEKIFMLTQFKKLFSSELELDQKIAAINSAFAIKMMKLWESDSLTVTKEGIHIQYQSAIPSLHFDDTLSIISKLQKENIISPTFQLTKQSLHDSSNKEFVQFDIPLVYLTKIKPQYDNNNPVAMPISTPKELGVIEIATPKDALPEKSKEIEIEKKHLILNPELFKQGPLPKKIATQLLEEMIHDLSIPGARYQFDINNEGLSLILLDNNGAAKKIHYLNLLLQSADLTHLRLEQDFLDLYTKAHKEKFNGLGVTPIGKMEEMFTERKLSPLDKKDEITEAHRYAIYHYTSSALTHHFNSFLRGNTQFLAKIAKREGVSSEYFQNLAFYTLSTLCIVTDYLAKCPIETDIAREKVATETLYRIQIHAIDEAKTVSIIKAIEQGKADQNNRFLIQEPSLMSTSADDISLATKVDVIDEKSSNKIVAIRFSDEYKKRIDSLSPYQGEKEVLLPPSDIQYTILRNEKNDGPFIFLDAKTVSPLDTEKNNAYILQHALRHVAHIVKKEFKDSKPWDIDHHLALSGYPVIQKPNHGLAHSGRQAKMIEDELDYFLKHGNKKTKELCEILKNNEMAINLIQIAALFLSVGRENEKSGEEDMKGYIKSRAAAKKYFEDYIQQYYANTLLADADLLKIYHYCRDIIQYLGSPEHLHNLGRQYQKSSNPDDLLHLIIYHLLTTAHLLETPRCLPLKVGQEILNQRLFDEIGGIILLNKSAAKDLFKLWELSIYRISQLGDRILGRRNYQPEIFTAASTSPSYLEKALELAVQKESIYSLTSTKKPDDKESQKKCNEAIFHLFYYLFKKSEDSTRQIEFFIEKDRIHLLDSAYQYFQTADKIKQDEPEVNRFMEAVQTAALKQIQHLIEQLPIPENVFADSDNFFIRNNCSITLDEPFVKYSINNSCYFQFYLGALESKYQEELRKVIADKTPLESYSADLKKALLKQMLLQEQSTIAGELINDYYKILLKWVCTEKLKPSDSNLRLFVEYLHQLLNFQIDNYDEITKKINNPFYLQFIDTIREGLTRRTPICIIHQEKWVAEQKIGLIASKHPWRQVSHELAEKTLLEKKDDQFILTYQIDNKWYVMGHNSKKEIIKCEVRETASSPMPSFECAYIMFNAHLANNEDDGAAQYKIGMCLKKGIWFDKKDEARAKNWFRKAEMNGHREAQKELGRKIFFTKEQQTLLQKVSSHYSDSTLWDYSDRLKLAALVDIYGGSFPDVYPKNDKLYIEYSRKLITFCEEHHLLIPSLKTINPVVCRHQESLFLSEISKSKYSKFFNTTPPTPDCTIDNIVAPQPKKSSINL